MTATGPARPDGAADGEVPDNGKRPVTPLAGVYGHPLHPMLVPIPIGAWVLSVVTDVASRTVDGRPWLAEASWWLLAIGILGAVGAATLGFLDLVAIPSGTRAHRTAVAHMSVNLLATAAFSTSLALRGSFDDARGEVAASHLGVSVLGLVLLTVGGFLGGELAYRYGIRVAAEADQAHAFRRPADLA